MTCQTLSFHPYNCWCHLTLTFRFKPTQALTLSLFIRRVNSPGDSTTLTLPLALLRPCTWHDQKKFCNIYERVRVLVTTGFFPLVFVSKLLSCLPVSVRGPLLESGTYQIFNKLKIFNSATWKNRPEGKSWAPALHYYTTPPIHWPLVYSSVK